ncbi:MAG: hypothetical protein IJD83_06520 [Clostridia bacterium]|nr:hypothetical protein [Clostridia bacterium]
MTFEDAINKADEELSALIVQSELTLNKGLRKIAENKLEWFAPLVYLAKKGLQAEKGGVQE